jgi:hypothetical protein
MLPDPIHIQTTVRQQELLREAAARRTGRPHVDEPRSRTSRLPQLRRRVARKAGPLAA